ncbi:TlpA family protein disulfide reductase [Sediminibacterium goheungense]|uniref:Thiol-disulfide isomerase/thioredoxin n=1 Tax=Sediminibacterium goheungense TaxID=1086393 RepID=A0A4R6J1U6_9BACT|nr:TlpA disulfide reductase family protein [Sediminibacterium goheungense]TDO28135.1 thiol-disulfide isomerase/thioredoxin [Sediminibacterium goheungense]
MRNRKQILAYIILTLVHSVVCLLAGALGWLNQIIIVQAVSVIIPFLAYKKVFANAFSSFLTTVPFFCVFIPASIYLKSVETYPIWISGIILSVLVCLLLKTSVKSIIIFSLFLIVILISSVWLMPNYLAKQGQRVDLSMYKLDDLKIVDANDSVIQLNRSRGKILIVDIWFTACAPCIRQFPDLERVKNEFKNDTNIRVIALNIPLKQSDDREQARRQTSKYSFEKLYFQYPEEVDKLSLKSFPVTLVFDKNLRCVYAGDLLINPLVYVDNIYSLIKKSKQ